MQDTLKSHYALLLGLDSDWHVVSVQLAVEQKRVSIALEFVGRRAVCPECGADCPLHDHAQERTWRHLDTMQFETLLCARAPRCQCAACGVRTLAVPWADKHSRFTLLFEAFAIEVLQASASVSAAAKLIGLSWDQAHAIMRRAVERGLARRKLAGLRHVGLDEKSFGKGQDYVTTLSDLDGARVLEVVPGRSEEASGSSGVGPSEGVGVHGDDLLPATVGERGQVAQVRLQSHQQGGCVVVALSSRAAQGLPLLGDLVGLVAQV